MMDSGDVILIGILSGLFIAVLLYFIGRGLAAYRLSKQVVNSGVEGKALITDKGVVYGRRTGYYVTYTFDVAGADGNPKSYSRKQFVGKNTYNTLTESAEVTVYYVPTHPAMALLGGIHADDHATNGAIILGIVSVILLFDVLFNFSPLLDRMRTADVLLTPTPIAYPAPLADDLVLIQTAVAPYRAEWEQVSDQTVHHVTPAPAGLSSFAYTDVIYGSCADGGFYLFVAKGLNATRFDAYGYTTEPNDVCRPSDWALEGKYNLRDGWFWATVIVRDAP